MPNLRLFLWPVLSLGLAFSLGGCPLAIVGGIVAAGGAGYAANQERGVTGTAGDFTVKTNIQAAWAQAGPDFPADFNATVYEGRVLLTGIAATPQIKDEAAQIASGVPGVRAVYDEIEVTPGETAWDSAKDAWITAQVRSDLVFSNIRSVNYNVETVDHSVYLIGSARSQAELDHATGLARNVPGVKRVVSYVEIRPGMPPGAEPPGPLPAAAEAPGDVPAAAPATPVEVQKL
jgi:osmotically-inducible protein OsmY